MIAPHGCNYPAGTVIDYYCLACGSTFAAHDDDNDCWRVLHSEKELAKYDEAMEIADAIRYGKSDIITLEADFKATVRGELCAPK